MKFDEAVYLVTSRVPRGRVTTYGHIAQAIGKPASCRAVGRALKRNPDTEQVPCYRVVRSDGKLGGYSRGLDAKAKRLRQDGIVVESGALSDLGSVLYKPSILQTPLRC